jgi:hypothetical protein
LTDPYLWGIEKDMAKRQTRRSISVSRSTYERLRAYCETNGISMSQFVEHRVGDFLGRSIRRPGAPMTSPSSPSLDDRRDAVPSAPIVDPMKDPMKVQMRDPVRDSVKSPVTSEAVEVRAAAPQPAPVVISAAPAAPAPTRVAIVHRPAPAAPPPAKLRPDQIFTF